MKLSQKGVAVLLAIIISTQSTALAYAETAEPTTVQTEDGVTFTHNSDGTVTATVYPKLEVRAMSAAPMTNILEDQGDSYASTGDNISLRLEKPIPTEKCWFPLKAMEQVFLFIRRRTQGNR